MRAAAWVGMAGLMLLAGVPVSAASAPTLVQKLENGLQVAIFRDTRLPIVQIQVVVPAGARDEAPLEAGAARVAALLLARGTSSRSASDFSAEVERLGATLAGQATEDYATLGAALRAADLEHGLELVADATINPIFEDAEVRRAQRDLLGALIESRNHLAVVADEHLWARVWRGHPYERPEIGTPEIVAALTRERILGFHRARYRPDRALLGIAGDVDPERALALAREHFGGWAGRVRADVAAPAATPAREARIVLVDVPQARQAEIRMGLAAPGRGHADAPALTVANDLLGGGPGSRLARGSRRVLPMYSALQIHKDGGLLAVATAARNDSVPAALERLRGELARLTAEPPTQAEVDGSRRYLSRAFTIQNEPLGVRSLQWLVGEMLGLGPDHPERHPQRIAGVGLEEVRGAVERWLAPAHAQIVVAGSAAELKGALEKLGPVDVVSVGDPPVTATVVPAMRMDEPDQAALDQGRKLVERMVAAHGGLAKLKGVKDSRLEAEVTLYSGERSVTGRQVEMRREPASLRIENLFQQVATVQALDGDQAWSRVAVGDRDTLRDEGAEGVAGLKYAFASDVVHVLLAAADPKSRIAYRGREESSAALEVIELVDAAGNRRVLLVDPARHRLVGVEENEGSILRGPVVRRSFGDFRTVKGILLPHSEERLLNGTRTQTFAVSKLDLNTGLSASAFKKPEESGMSRPRR